MSYNNIPQELRELPHWVTWRSETVPGRAKPAKVPFNPATGAKAEPDNPKSWTAFDAAVWAASTGQYNGIGYVLSQDDPYTFIDLDTYNNGADIERHKAIANAFSGYAEISPSGQGLHLIVKGSVPEGRRRNGIEIYSSKHYFTFTGNVYRPGPIVEQQNLVNQLWAELAPVEKLNGFQSYVEQSATEDDRAIIDRAANAYNKEKFNCLWNGQWQLDYPSQSEADFALIDIIGFYSKDREQVKRIFRLSMLGRRDKAKREGYLNDMIVRSQDNQAPAIDIERLKTNIETSLRENNRQPINQELEPEVKEVSPYSVPTGLLGEIAQYIYAAAPLPVPEIALAGAIGLMAGISGRAYNIRGAGLNQYILLLAPTGSGKEAIASGLSFIMQAVRRLSPASAMFIGPGQIRSDAALYKYLAKDSSSFVSVIGEFGQTIAQMAATNASSQMRGIKQAFLDLYGKSGQGLAFQPTIYSQRENSTAAILSPALTIIGESAPEPFYESIDERLISDGLLPRFTLIEYTGKRVALNNIANCLPGDGLIQKVTGLCNQALMMNSSNNVCNIEIDISASNMLAEFERYTRNEINDAPNEVTRHVWNRAHLRAQKLAGLLAVGNNPFKPTVFKTDVEWSIGVSVANTKALLLRFQKGEVGSGTHDYKQCAEIIRIISNYVVHSWQQVKPYSPYENMHNQRVVPYSYINKRLAASSAFRLDRLGATAAIHRAIKVLIDNGDIAEIGKQDIFNRFGVSARSFAICNIKTFS